MIRPLSTKFFARRKNIAVVGMSDKPWRASHNIGRYLAEHGYRVFPVNPALKEILGLHVLPRISTRRRPRPAPKPAQASIWSMSFAPPSMCRPLSTT